MWFDGSKFHKYPKDISQAVNEKIAAGQVVFSVKPKSGVGKYHFEVDIMLQTISRTKEQRIISSTAREDFSKDLGMSHSWIPRIHKPLPDESNLKLVPLAENDPEYMCVKTLFNLSVTRKIETIHKVINHRIRQQFDLELDQVRQKNRNNPAVRDYCTRLLFHGTKNTEPTLIYNGEKGFMMQFAAEGYWGRGTYFAEKACYSHHYSSTPKDTSGVRQMFLAEVIVGDAKYLKPDRSLIVPPEKPKKEASTDLALERYDSVTGLTGGTRVWIVYDNNKAYPTYLITYKASNKA